MSPRVILALGWAFFAIYAYPGFMSYDSVKQLIEARDGVFAGGHPPLMGLLWRAVDALVAGPFGMLVLQSGSFLAGVYLLLCRAMSPRAAAIAASLVLCFPPIAAVLAVIWKDSQMVGYLALGTALLVSDTRRTRLAGLALLFLATGMRYNAFGPTFPLVTLLFVWTPGQRWFVRYPIAVAAWLAVTLAAGTVNGALSTGPSHWHRSMALIDLTGTLRYADPVADDELAGVPLRVAGNVQAAVQASYAPESINPYTLSTFGAGEYVPDLLVRMATVFDDPWTPDERAAVARAWRRVVLGHLGAYARYRWHVTRERLQLGTSSVPPAAYVWFVNVGDPWGSAAALGHIAIPGKLQRRLIAMMTALGTTSLFRPWLYLALACLALAGACVVRDRLSLALSLSAIANEAVLFVLAPTIDYRYSVWLVTATLVGAIASVPGYALRGSTRHIP